jgi:hypothetical protein
VVSLLRNGQIIEVTMLSISVDTLLLLSANGLLQRNNVVLSISPFFMSLHALSSLSISARLALSFSRWF